jgi:inhibitor of cysteine peptidase
MSKGIKAFFAILLMLIVIVVIGIAAFIIFIVSKPDPIIPIIDTPDKTAEFELKKFASKEEMEAYFSDPNQSDYYSKNEISAGNLPAADGAVRESAPERYSKTNIQVAGIDEPDIVKTDGNTIFLSADEYYYPMLRTMNRIAPELMENPGTEPDSKLVAPGMPYPYITPQPLKTRVIDALPPETMSKLSEIDFTGDLLLEKDILMIISPNNGIKSYDIKNKSNPQKTWEIEYNENFTYTNARLSNGKLYLVLNSYIYTGMDCPIKPLKGAAEITIACTDVYYPVGTNISNNITNIFKIDTTTGKIEDSLSYVGADQYSSVFYMSEKNTYLTFQDNIDTYEFFIGYIKAKGSEVISQIDVDRILKIDGYDISTGSKSSEISSIIYKYQYLDGKENEKLKNSVLEYFETVKRKLEKTQLVRVSMDDLEVAAKGEIPGRLLNQFSLDEYQSNLRVSTTIENNWLFGISNDLSSNDVYVLNSNLEIIGSAMDMGKGERIYATRFMGDVAYLVTFKETDPFYVLDLSNPNKPEIKGELKIPGYSSYLHKLEENLILGIGYEENNVKLSLFDVSDPSNPKEISKLSLKNIFWTEAANNHHAFMQDEKHKVFFLPAEGKGMIISYADSKLTQLKEITNAKNAKRALYINDYLYIIGNEEIVVLNETNWQEIKTVELK